MVEVVQILQNNSTKDLIPRDYLYSTLLRRENMNNVDVVPGMSKRKNLFFLWIQVDAENSFLMDGIRFLSGFTCLFYRN